VQLNSTISELPLQIFGNSNQLEEVMINRLNNSTNAVQYVAQATIDVTLERAASPSSENFLDTTKQCAQLTVSDNGKGIAKENIDRVFDPFFTTKDVGEGTGLGLSMVYGAVQTHKGHIEIKSEIGKGTSIIICLPLYEGDENDDANNK
jgi:signal transduction histidine kinase